MQVEERMAAREARLREERIEAMHRRGLLRIKHQGLARALSRWQEMRETRHRLRRTAQVDQPAPYLRTPDHCNSGPA